MNALATNSWILNKNQTISKGSRQAVVSVKMSAFLSYKVTFTAELNFNSKLCCGGQYGALLFWDSKEVTWKTRWISNWKVSITSPSHKSRNQSVRQQALLAYPLRYSYSSSVLPSIRTTTNPACSFTFTRCVLLRMMILSYHHPSPCFVGPFSGLPLKTSHNTLTYNFCSVCHFQ